MEKKNVSLSSTLVNRNSLDKIFNDQTNGFDKTIPEVKSASNFYQVLFYFFNKITRVEIFKIFFLLHNQFNVQSVI